MSRRIGITIVALSLTATAATAQEGGRKLDPSRTQSGSSATSNRGSVDAPASRGSGTGENKPSATGGQPGGGTGQQ